jgi:hypothetical protein
VANSNRLLLMRGGRVRSEIETASTTPERVQEMVEAAR